MDVKKNMSALAPLTDQEIEAGLEKIGKAFGEKAAVQSVTIKYAGGKGTSGATLFPLPQPDMENFVDSTDKQDLMFMGAVGSLISMSNHLAERGYLCGHRNCIAKSIMNNTVKLIDPEWYAEIMAMMAPEKNCTVH